jgi:hypothetical protein
MSASRSRATTTPPSWHCRHAGAARRHRRRRADRCHHAAWLLPQPHRHRLHQCEWDEIAGLIKAKGILPILDLAYQGLGQGMEEDAYGIRTVLAAVPKR